MTAPKEKTLLDARPLPWVVKPAQHALGGTFGVQDANGVWVAMVHPRADGLAEDVASMLAAAPEMFAVLFDLAADPDIDKRMFQRITEAVAKAGGLS